ncbi:MAG: hypothetical protein ACREOO_09700 [bacterium]
MPNALRFEARAWFKPWCALIINLLPILSPANAEQNGALASSAAAASALLAAPAAAGIRERAGANAPVSISYTFIVDKQRPEVDDNLFYTLTVWNDPLQSDTLRSIEAEFNLPRLENGNFALQPSSFQYAGTYPFTIDAAQGKVVWRVGDIIRHSPPQPDDTARIVFSFRLAEVSDFSLTCGENPITAFARVSFLQPDGQRIFPGTPRAAESTLFLTPDFVAERVDINPNQVQSGEILTLEYFFRNDGNVGREVSLCLRFPPGLDSDVLVGVLPDSIEIPAVQTDSLCLQLGFVSAGSARRIQLRIIATAAAAPPFDVLCFNGRLQTDCDIRPENNFFPPACATLAPLDLLAVQKRGDRASLRVGDTLHYSINFSNVALNVPAWNVTLTDTLPAGVDFITASQPYALANGILSWSRAQFPAGARDSVSFIVRIRADFYSNSALGQACLGANLTNVATITSTAADASPSGESPSRMQNNRAAYTAFVEPLGDLLDLQLSVSALPPASLANLMPGDTLLYELRYFNRNDAITATNVTLIDTLPDAAYLQLLQTPAGFVYDAADNVLRRDNFALVPLASQNTTYRMLLRDDVALCQTVTLGTRAAISEPSGWDCQLQNNIASNALTFVARANLLALAVQANATVVPGEEFEVVLQASNVSDLGASAVTLHNLLAPALAIVAINDGGVSSAPNQIRWELGALPPRQSRIISFRAHAPDSVNCAAITTGNLAWLESSPADCRTVDDTVRTTITILPTPLEQQPRLAVTSVRARDSNGDGCAEPGEKVIAQITVVNSNAQDLIAQEITFIDPCALVAGTCATMTLIDLSPATLAPEDSAIATFEFVIRENNFSTQTITVSLGVAALGFCPAFVNNLPVTDLRFCPQPEVVLRLDLNDANGNNDGLAAEKEPLNLVAITENTGPIPADSVDLYVTLAPLRFVVLQSNQTIPAEMPMHWRSRLAPGGRDSLFLQFQYDDFSAQDAVVAASAHVQVSAIAGPQPSQNDQLVIQKDCYARPNPFLPLRHSGVSFAPNDGQRVEIFDLQGNLIRSFVSPGPWDGRDERGRLCDPGFYVWKIENACQGSIVVVR